MTTPCAFERLEDRRLLTVTLKQKGATLSIVSDGDGDDIAIETTAPGVVEVDVDQDFIGDFTFTGVSNVVFKGDGGDDELHVGNLDIGGKFTYQGGAGDDNLFFEGNIDARVVVDMNIGDDEVGYDLVAFYQPVTIELGSGDDVSFGAGAAFLSTLRIEAGVGDDEVHHDAFYGGNSYFANVVILMGQGDDLHEEDDGTFDADLKADGGRGFDTFDDNGGTTVAGLLTFTRYEVGSL